jgi:hypothetical protein
MGNRLLDGDIDDWQNKTEIVEPEIPPLSGDPALGAGFLEHEEDDLPLYNPLFD